MDYLFTITEYDADNVQLTTPVVNGRIEHWLDLTAKTYETHRIGSNIATKITALVWGEHLQLIQSYIDREIERVRIQLLLEKTRLYEVTYFSNFVNAGPNSIQESNKLIDEANAVLAYLKTYNKLI